MILFVIVCIVALLDDATPIDVAVLDRVAGRTVANWGDRLRERRPAPSPVAGLPVIPFFAFAFSFGFGWHVVGFLSVTIC